MKPITLDVTIKIKAKDHKDLRAKLVEARDEIDWLIGDTDCTLYRLGKLDRKPTKKELETWRAAIN